MRKEINMKLSNKLVLPVLAISLISGSAFAHKAPEFVSDLLTPAQAAFIAGTSTALFGAFAWAMNEDINTEIARKEKKHNKKVEVNPIKRIALVTLPAALVGGFVGAVMYLGISMENVDQYLKDNAKLNETIAQTTQEILLGSGI
jgi:uncharacterized protein YneF (UPF0154 family)